MEFRIVDSEGNLLLSIDENDYIMANNLSVDKSENVTKITIPNYVSEVDTIKG